MTAGEGRVTADGSRKDDLLSYARIDALAGELAQERGNDEADLPEVVCPFCGRTVATFLARYGVEIMFGHRTVEETLGAPWCEGGGRAPR